MLKLPPVLTTVCILPSCILVHFNPPWNPSHCRKDSEGRKILIQQSIVWKSFIGFVCKTALEGFGQSWEMMKTLMRRALPPMISFPVLYDGIVIECNGKIQTQAIESWQKELTKRHVLPAPKESLFFWVPLAAYIHKILCTLIALMNATYTFLKCWHISLTCIWRKDSL